MLICQVTDLHVCPPGQLAYGKIDTNGMTDRAFAAVAAFRPSPAAVLVTGDLVEDGSESAYAHFLAMAKRHLDQPVYVIPGNHDRRDKLRQVLAGLPGLSTSGPYIQYAIDEFRIRIVMLDTHVPGEPYGELCAERLAFLEQTLAAAPEQPTLVAMHHPPFKCGISFMDAIALRNAPEFEAVVARHRQVRRIVCGHVHRGATGTVAGIPTMIAPSTCHQLALNLQPGAPGAYVYDPPAFLVHRWTEADGLASHTAFIDPTPGPFPFSE